MDEQAKLKANEEYFRKYGFEIEPFGGREYCISAVPTNLYGFHEEELFLEMLDNLGGEGARMLLTFSQQDLPQWHANLLSKEIIRCLLWRQIS